MMNLFSDEMRRNPFPIFDQIRRASPVFKVPGAETWMLFDYATVKRARNDPDAFGSRAGGSPLAADFAAPLPLMVIAG